MTSSSQTCHMRTKVSGLHAQILSEEQPYSMVSKDHTSIRSLVIATHLRFLTRQRSDQYHDMDSAWNVFIAKSPTLSPTPHTQCVQE